MGQILGHRYRFKETYDNLRQACDYFPHFLFQFSNIESASVCHDLCTGNAACLAFSWHGDSLTCHLKPAVTSLSSRAGTLSGTPCTMPLVTGTDFTDIFWRHENVPGFFDCVVTCKKFSSTCRFYNYISDIQECHLNTIVKLRFAEEGRICGPKYNRLCP